MQKHNILCMWFRLAQFNLKIRRLFYLALEWVEYNYMKLNQGKRYSLMSKHKYENVWANIGSYKIWESKDQKILGANIHHNLKFSHYIFKQGKKVGRKLSTLTRISKFTSLECARVLTKSFIESQFAYCPLVWMCCDKTSDNRINH